MTESKKLEFPELAAALRSRKDRRLFEILWARRDYRICDHRQRGNRMGIAQWGDFWLRDVLGIQPVLHHKSRSSVFRSAIYDPNRRASHGTLGTTPRTEGIIPSRCRRGHGGEFSILFVQLAHHARHDFVVDII